MMKYFMAKLPALLIGSLLLIGCSGGLDEVAVDDRVISLQLLNGSGNEISRISAASPGHLVARLTNAGGTPLPGETLSFTTTLGYIMPAAATAETDEEGRASVSLLAGSIPGAGQVTAALEEYSSTLEFTSDGDMDINLAVQLVSKENGTTTDKISTDSPGRLVATLTYGPEKIPMADQVLTFSTSLGTIHPKDGTALTDENGQASADLLAGPEAGNGEATVTFDEYSVIQKFFVQDISLSLSLVRKESWHSARAAWKTTNTVSSDAPAYLVASLDYVNGEPISDKVVKFSTTLGGILPLVGDIQPGDVQSQEGTALTDKDGRAVVWLLAGSEPGAGEVTATYGEYLSEPLGFTTIGDLDVHLDVRLISRETGNPTNTVSADLPGELLATLRYGIETPIVNEVIQFSTTLGNIHPEKGTALTDSNGKASVDLLAGSEQGAGEITATYGDYSASCGFYTPGNQKDVNLSLELSDDGGETTNIVSAGSIGYLAATLTDAGGKPIAGKVIFFSSTLGNTDPGNGSATTDEQGCATVFLLAGSEPGSGQATAELSDPELGDHSDTLAFYTLDDQKTDVNLSLRLLNRYGYPINTVSDATSGHAEATLAYANGTPVPNKVIIFNTTLGHLYPASGTALTDNNGHAIIDLLAGSEAGVGEISATFAETSASLNFETLGDQPGEINIRLRLENAAGEEITTISNESPGRLLATLTDEERRPVANKLVTFSTTIGSIEPLSVLTDQNGVAVVSLLAGSEPGAGQLTAVFTDPAAGEYTDSTDFETLGDQPGKIILSVRLSDDAGEDTDRIDANLPGSLVATLTDESGTPIPDRIISFNTNQGNTEPSSAVTNKNGEATVFLLAGDAAPGPGEVTATFYDQVSGYLSDTLTFYITVDPEDMNLSLQLLDSAGKIRDQISADSPGRLVATLQDAVGQPVSDQLVTFTTTIGNLDPPEGMAVTDRNGQASADLSAGSIQGDGVATVTFGEHSASVGFSTAGDQVNIRIRLLRDETGYVTNMISAEFPGRLEATLLYADGKSVSDQPVAFSARAGVIHPSEGIALTDSNGVASVLLLADSEPGPGVATAEFGEYSSSLSFSNAGDQPEDVNIFFRLINDETGETTDKISESVTGRLEAILTDAGGMPVPDQVVSFSASAGRIDPSSGVALTDDEGVASVRLFATPYPGPGVATVKYGEYSENLSFDNE